MNFEEIIQLSLGPLGIVRDDDKYWMFEVVMVELHGLLEVPASQGHHAVDLLVDDVVCSPDVNTHNVTVFSCYSSVLQLLVCFSHVLVHYTIQSLFGFL